MDSVPLKTPGALGYADFTLKYVIPSGPCQTSGKIDRKICLEMGWNIEDLDLLTYSRDAK